MLFGGEPINTAYPVIKETIPASHLGYHTNNRYDGFPPLMNDGRSIIAGARSETLLHNSILKQMNSNLDSKSSINNAQYREYMTKNARQIMEADFRNASNDVGYYERFADQIRADNGEKSVSGTPYLYSGVSDTAKPFGYSESDLKSIYLSREELDARRMTAAFVPTTVDKTTVDKTTVDKMTVDKTASKK